MSNTGQGAALSRISAALSITSSRDRKRGHGDGITENVISVARTGGTGHVGHPAPSGLRRPGAPRLGATSASGRTLVSHPPGRIYEFTP
jgi:hypothetical protein